MENVVGKSNLIILRKTQEADLDFVVNSEREPINSQYVGQWTKEQHLNALAQKDILHLIVEDAITYEEVGYVIMAGLDNLDHNIEFRRIVISDKGKGFGRETLKLVKEIVFNQLNGHRLWLDVREKNRKAQNLYQSVGFIKEGIFRECISYNEQFESLMVMSILENEFRRGFEWGKKKQINKKGEQMNRLEEIHKIVDTILMEQSNLEERRCGYIHLYGVSCNCSLLAMKRGLNIELCSIAGMLHDISSYKTGYSIDHAKLSSIEARKILNEINCFSEEEINIICSSIFNHSNKQNIDNIYDEILKDSDVLQHYFYNTNFQISGNDKDRLDRVIKELGISK